MRLLTYRAYDSTQIVYHQSATEADKVFVALTVTFGVLLPHNNQKQLIPLR
jgi:hypothetical protein